MAGAPVTGALQDPVLELHDANGDPIASNDNWRTGGQETEIEAMGLAPEDDREAALFPPPFIAPARLLQNFPTTSRTHF